MIEQSQRTVYVLIEPHQDRLSKWVRGLLEAGRRLAAEFSGRLEIVAFGLEEHKVADLPLISGLDHIHLCPKAVLSVYDGESFAAVLSPLLEQEPASIVLMADTPMGQDMATRLTANGHCRMIAHCSELHGLQDRVEAYRLVMGGQMERSICSSLDQPLVVTMNLPRLPLTLGTTNRSRPPISIIEELPSPKSSELLGIDPLDTTGPALEEADIVVAGGWGAGDEEGFALVSELAAALGGATAGSAVAAEKGWIPRTKQIGRSGRTVYPDLFVACGISGSIHFTSGMDQSGLIVAVNTDQDAPIFKQSDIRIIGDLRKVIPIWIDRIRTGSQE